MQRPDWRIGVIVGHGNRLIRQSLGEMDSGTWILAATEDDHASNSMLTKFRSAVAHPHGTHSVAADSPVKNAVAARNDKARLDAADAINEHQWPGWRGSHRQHLPPLGNLDGNIDVFVRSLIRASSTGRFRPVLDSPRVEPYVPAV